MARNPRFDILFEPVKLGPVTAPNRFYQVPHCTGMGYQRPRMMAALRGIKAEGGWGVVCTEYCSIDSSSDSPFPHASLRDDDDVRNLRAMTDAVHAHGALAGVELWYGGHSNANLNSREISFGVSSLTSGAAQQGPGQSRAMDKTDIRAFRRMYRDAARRALDAGFDIVYVYSNHWYLLHSFLDPVLNQRTDEYGGPVKNRVRLLGELIEDVAQVVADRAAVAVRFSVSPDIDNDPGGTLECFDLVSDLPDLWDITVDDYNYEMGSSRFVREAAQQPAMTKVKSMTRKPVVGVGRFTSPDTMVRQIKQGAQDFIGAARPSIADPFLPHKIDQGREDDIRECIGCNICYAHDYLGAPIRCTQNPTMGEEWRRGWHPERITPRHADQSVLVVGAGPAGLEAASALGKRGYAVTMAEAEDRVGGRINLEAGLPGLAEWSRVRDWRFGQLSKMANVSMYPGSRLGADDILEFGFQHVLLATGSSWRTDGTGGLLNRAFEGFDCAGVIDMNRVLRGQLPEGRIVIFDDDHYYLAGAAALLLAENGCAVRVVTAESRFAHWSHYTSERSLLMKALLEAGVEISTELCLRAWEPGRATFACVHTDVERQFDADGLLPITARSPDDTLWHALEPRMTELRDKGVLSLQRIGDCLAPGLIAAAVYSGHRAARNLGQEELPARRDRVVA